MTGLSCFRYARDPAREAVPFDLLHKLKLFRFLSCHIFSWGTGPITVDWKENRPAGTSLDCMVTVAWLQEKQGNILKFRQPSNAMWRHFKNYTLINPTNRSGQKSDHFREIIESCNMGYIGRYFISSDYGHKVLTRLSIKECLQKSANEWLESHIKGDWVAVHYRGTDTKKHRNGYCKKRYRIDLKPCVTYLKAVLDSQYSIFACSDQAQFIDEMKAAFPERVFARDIKRSHDNTPLHKPLVPLAKYDNYEHERDALIDILILAKAGLIYTTGSGFVDVVRYFNPETKIISLDGRPIGGGKNNVPIPEPDLFKRLAL